LRTNNVIQKKGRINTCEQKTKQKKIINYSRQTIKYKISGAGYYYTTAECANCIYSTYVYYDKTIFRKDYYSIVAGYD
jgi:hypothetical protein